MAGGGGRVSKHGIGRRVDSMNACIHGRRLSWHAGGGGIGAGAKTACACGVEGHRGAQRGTEGHRGAQRPASAHPVTEGVDELAVAALCRELRQLHALAVWPRLVPLIIQDQGACKGAKYRSCWVPSCLPARLPAASPQRLKRLHHCHAASLTLINADLADQMAALRPGGCLDVPSAGTGSGSSSIGGRLPRRAPGTARCRP